MAADCVPCGRPIADTAYCCSDCGRAARTHLDDIANLAGPARDVAHGQARRGPAVAGGSAGGLPINLPASARLDAVTNQLVGWVRILADDHGGPIHLTGEPIADAARYIAGHVNWLRYQQYADEAFSDFDAAARILRGIVDGPGPRRWLGRCGAPAGDGPCRADLTARAGANTAICRSCGAEVVVADRRRELDQLARGYAYTAAEIAAAYPEVKAERIRQWASRKRIFAVGEVDGRPVYDLGEVLDRAAVEAARLATEQAKRARRRDTDELRDRELAS